MLPLNIHETLIQTGELLGDRRRLTMLMALVDGQAWPAGDLARVAGIRPATASHHLEQLVAGGLLTMMPQGRHRYYRLATVAVAELLEKLAALSPPAPAQSLRGTQQRDALRQGRTCYDHLAGKLGVALTRAWLVQGWVVSAPTGYTITEAGAEWLARLDITVEPGQFVPQHAVDWTERVPHLAGPLAKAVTQRLIALGWLERGSVPRSVHVTEQGTIDLARIGMSLGS
ncbi:MAG: helix-turn-helix transcriptional regulator [Thermaerobacter sp.]|nr:helix-turn-helix transcriptional regulator [Thermaerobacter sp.]